jgi:hypothetical protein
VGEGAFDVFFDCVAFQDLIGDIMEWKGRRGLDVNE